jgi:hypothetical protein
MDETITTTTKNEKEAFQWFFFYSISLISDMCLPHPSTTHMDYQWPDWRWSEKEMEKISDDPPSHHVTCCYEFSTFGINLWIIDVDINARAWMEPWFFFLP